MPVLRSATATNVLPMVEVRPGGNRPSTQGGPTRDVNNTYPDRPAPVIAGETCTIHSRNLWSKVDSNQRGLGSWATTCPGPHNPRVHFGQYIGSKACDDAQILESQEKGSRSLICRLLHTPEGPINHFKT